MAVRKIIEIDESKCDGCGDCIGGCAEGALALVDGKARLVSDVYCDGLGACLAQCHTGALQVIEREADDFDETAVEQRLAEIDDQPAPPAAPAPRYVNPHAHGGGCPSARLLEFAPRPSPGGPAAEGVSALSHWPVKLKLVPPMARFLAGADLLLAADCVPFAHPDLHTRLLPGHVVLIGCPKFDAPQADYERLAAILAQNEIRSLTVAIMEVPCCHGYLQLARRALAESGKPIPLRVVEIGLNGAVKADSQSAIG